MEMNEVVTMTPYGLAVVLRSPCCRKEMKLRPGNPVLNHKDMRIDTPLNFECSSCKSVYDVSFNYHIKFTNVKIEFTINNNGDSDGNE